MPVLYCPAEAIDAVTGQCSDPHWIEFPTLLPPLSVEDGLKIAGAVALVWAIGYTGRLLRYAMRGRI